MILAQISDLHVTPEGRPASGRVDGGGFLERAVAHVTRLVPAPAAVLATGDLVDRGSPEEYRRLARLLAPLAMPVYLVPGNHDDRRALADVFAGAGYLPRHGPFLHYTVEDLAVRLIVLDTVLPGRGGGLLCDERLAWLDARLAEAPARPTLIAMHHPPFVTGIGHMDRVGLEGGEALGAIVERYAHIEAIVCGHVHRPIVRRWHGTIVMTAPGTAHQVVLDLHPGGPAEFAMEPPALYLHRWEAGAGLVTHTSYIGSFAGPFPFTKA